MSTRAIYRCLLSILVGACGGAYGIDLQVKPIFSGQQKNGASTEVRLSFTAPQQGDYLIDISADQHHYQSSWALQKDEIVELALLTPPLSGTTAKLLLTSPNQEASSTTLTFSTMYGKQPLVLLVQEDTQPQTTNTMQVITSNAKGFAHHAEALSSIDHIILAGGLLPQLSDQQLIALLSFIESCGSVTVIAKPDMMSSLQQTASCNGQPIGYASTVQEALSTLPVVMTNQAVPLANLIAAEVQPQALLQQISWIIVAYFTVLLGILWLFPRPLMIGVIPVVTTLILGIFLLKPSASISHIVWTEQDVASLRMAWQTQYISVQGRAPGDISFELAAHPIQRFYAEGDMAIYRHRIHQDNRVTSNLHSHFKLLSSNKASFSNYQPWPPPFQVRANAQGLLVDKLKKNTQAGFLVHNDSLWHWPALQAQTKHSVQFADLKPVKISETQTTLVLNSLLSHYDNHDWVIVLPPPLNTSSQSARSVAHWYVLKHRKEIKL